VVVSNTYDLPIDKTLLRRSVKYFNREKLELRDQRYLRDFEVNFIFDNEVLTMNKDKGQHVIELKDETTIVGKVIILGF